MRMKKVSLLTITTLVSFVMLGCGAGNGANEEIVHDGVTHEETAELEETVGDDQTTADELGQAASLGHILEFELEIDLVNDEEIEMEYKQKGGEEIAEVETKTAEGKQEKRGREAIEEIQNLVSQTALDPNTDPKEAMEQILATLNISNKDVRKLELEVDFTTGEKLKGNFN
ncbi:YusW family protein [Alkalihalobacterium chitinilyticum]|uniref:YusW family protein n=1 Tax=Alkalihalobacterium chitinilyticum TaxID=2980103 RepID=A0ABT5VIU7_9BACI|nr:YusW family protein [Alkalihalobacterium chitinilyticum]MDE5415096.1 YusW family protein [Alkalihalobacterium chitinilyticum]